MSRPAEELLEFDRLKDIVSRSTTCAPGRRAIEALVPQQDVASLDAEFALVREAIAYLRAGSELGFGSLADPEAWLARLGMPGSVLSRGTSRRRFAVENAVQSARHSRPKPRSTRVWRNAPQRLPISGRS